MSVWFIGSPFERSFLSVRKLLLRMVQDQQRRNSMPAASSYCKRAHGLMTQWTFTTRKLFNSLSGLPNVIFIWDITTRLNASFLSFSTMLKHLWIRHQHGSY